MSFSVKVEGLSELEAHLEKLKPATGRAALRRAGIASLEGFARSARGKAPIDEEELFESIDVSTKLSDRQAKQHKKMVRDDRSSVEVFAGAGPLPQAHLQEFGTYKEPPQPFMRPAWEEERLNVLSELKNLLWFEVLSAVERSK